MATVTLTNPDLNIDAVRSTTITAGQAVYIKSDGELALADANATSYGAAPCVGFAFTDAVDGDVITVATRGFVEGLSGLTVGQVVYLSATAGAVTSTKPIGSSYNYQQVVGFATSATQMVISVDLPGTEA
jgi:hypothetical protein